MNKDNELNPNEFKLGQVVYCSQINECCEGWEAETFHKCKVLKINENPNGRKEIKLSKGITVYLNEKGENEYSYHTKFFKEKEDILNYISESVLID